MDVWKVQVYDAKIEFWNQQGTKIAHFRWETAAEIMDQRRKWVSFRNRRWRDVSTNHIYGGSHRADIQKTTATFRGLVPDILRNPIFVGRGKVRALAMAVLCDRVDREAVHIDTLRESVMDIIKPTWEVIAMDVWPNNSGRALNIQ